MLEVIMLMVVVTGLFTLFILYLCKMVEIYYGEDMKKLLITAPLLPPLFFVFVLIVIITTLACLTFILY